MSAATEPPRLAEGIKAFYLDQQKVNQDNLRQMWKKIQYIEIIILEFC